MTSARNDNADMPEWQRLLLELDEEQSPPASSVGDERGSQGGSGSGDTRAQTSTQDELYADAIPDVNTNEDLPEVYKVSDAEVDRILSTTPIEQQYAKFGKGDTPEVRGDERIIRCVHPDHEDKNPSASYNVRNGAYNCFKCGGSDILRIAAERYGMNDDSSDLPYIKRRLAGELSGSPVEQYGNHEVLATPTVRAAMEAEAKKEQDESRAEMEQLRQRLIDNREDVNETVEELEQDFSEAVPEFDTSVPPPLPAPESTPPSTQADLSFALDKEPPENNYESMLEPGTFLHNFYTACAEDLIPNDFHFFNGLLALGYAAGRDARLFDFPPVYGNMYMCFVAPSGAGKSRSRYWLDLLLREALPFDSLDHLRSGVQRLADPGSGEVLIETMIGKEIPYPNKKPGDPATTKGRLKGLVYLDEFETFMKKAERPGSTLKTVVTSMYNSDEVSNASRGGGILVAQEPFFSLSANVPPEKLRTIVTRGDASSGFLNRFTFVNITSGKEQTFMPDPIDFPLDDLSLKLREIMAWCQVRRNITMSPEAAKMLEEFFKLVLAKDIPLANLDPNGEGADEMLARLDLAVKKYLLLFAVNEMKEVIDIPVAEKAIRLYWITRKNLQVVGVKIGTSAAVELEEYIIERVRSSFARKPEPLTSGDIKGGRCQVARKMERLGLTRKDFEVAMRNLVAAGDLVEIRPDKADKRVKPKYVPHAD